MVYTTDQPADVDVGLSRAILAANTNTANDAFGIDHVKFSESTNQGYHHYIHLDAAYDGTAGITAPTVGTDITNLFATNTLITGTKPLPVFRNATGVGFLMPIGAMVQFSASTLTTYPVTITPSGTYINYSKIEKTDANTYVITFSKSMTSTTYQVILSYRDRLDFYVSSKAAATLTLKYTGIGYTDEVSVVVLGVVTALA